MALALPVDLVDGHHRLESFSQMSFLEIYDEDEEAEPQVDQEQDQQSHPKPKPDSNSDAKSVNNPRDPFALATGRPDLSKPFSTTMVRGVLGGDFDVYGFKKASAHVDPRDYNKWFHDYAEYLEGRKKKWLAVVKANGLLLDRVPTRFPPKSDKVKKLVRRGIPNEWRGSAWFFYAGGYDKLNKHVGVYDQIVRDTKNIHNKDTDVIDRDLLRTFPDNKYFNPTLVDPEANALNGPMIKSLRRVLVAFAHYQPQIGYCQSLNFLAGLLLLFMSEERAFWMLVILTEKVIPKVHSANLEGVHTDQGVLMLCIKEYIPQLWSILGNTFDGQPLPEDKILTKLPPVSLVTSSWFMSVFIGNLPIETVLRIWDILWYEGSKTIFRFCLTICKLCLDHPEFSQNRSKSQSELDQIEFFQFMQTYPKTLLDPNIVVDHCFKKIGGYGYGSLSQDEINKCRNFVSKQRNKLAQKKNNVINTEISEAERRVLLGNDNDDIHDVYGFNRSIMSGIAWNNNISNKMKKRFTRKPSRSNYS